MSRAKRHTLTSERAQLRTGVAAALGLVVATHVVGYWLYLARFDTGSTVYPVAQSEGASAGPPLARRVWVVILDGLREDLGEKLPHLSALAAQGVRRPLESEFPAFTHPNVTAMVSGLPPFYSGVRLNSGGPHPPFDTVIAAADEAGVPTLMVHEDFPEFPIALAAVPSSHARSLALAELIRRPPAHELAFIHVNAIDAAGHRRGADSPQYIDAAIAADRQTEILARTLDLDRDLLLVISDHGHLDSGGHGGLEPEVTRAYFLAVGAGLRRGVYLTGVRMRDLAPTLALAAGLRPPRDSLGKPLIDLFTRAVDVSAFTRQHRALEDRLAALQLDERAIPSRLRARRAVRLAIAASVLMLAGFAIFRLRRALGLRFRADELLPLAIFVVLFCALYFLSGYRLSWSIRHGASGFYEETALMGLLAGALALLFGWRHDRAIAQSFSVVWLVPPFVLSQCAAGLSPAWLESPRVTFLALVLATLAFYGALTLGVGTILTLARLRRTARPANLLRARRLDPEMVAHPTTTSR